VLGTLLLLALLVFGLVRACGTPGSDDEGAGSQGEDTTQEEEQASSGDTSGESQAAGEEGGIGAEEAAAAVEIARAQGADAAAQLQDAQGNPVGTASFTDVPNGSAVTVELQQGQQAVTPGEHAIHIHERGDITPDFEAAGEHWNPTNAQHGFDNPQGPHAGDLENIVVNEDGSASYQSTSRLITLAGDAESSLLDSDGSALVIHERADDYRTDPAGDSGDRVAAGIIRGAATGEATVAGEMTSGPLPRSGGPTIGSVLLPAAALLLGSGILAFAVLRRRR
jgi:superoxide dismutase, Cu-Zn family